jgi:hypothetical protein
VHSVFGKINYGGLKHRIGTGTANWWLTEPHLLNQSIFKLFLQCEVKNIFKMQKYSIKTFLNYFLFCKEKTNVKVTQCTFNDTF